MSNCNAALFHPQSCGGLDNMCCACQLDAEREAREAAERERDTWIASDSKRMDRCVQLGQELDAALAAQKRAEARVEGWVAALAEWQAAALAAAQKRAEEQPADKPELTNEEEVRATQSGLLALALGYNELAKHATRDGDKVYWRLMRTEVVKKLGHDPFASQPPAGERGGGEG